MERDPGPHAYRAHRYTPQQPPLTSPTQRPCASLRPARPPSGPHGSPALPTGPAPQAQEHLRRQSDLRPQFRLRPGPDDALIRWLGSLSPRQRSRAIRTALCQYLDEQSNRRPTERREDPDLAHALDSLFPS
jgi:hypothetical protein